MKGLLIINPEERMQSSEALNHPYFEGLMENDGNRYRAAHSSAGVRLDTSRSRGGLRNNAEKSEPRGKVIGSTSNMQQNHNTVVS
jgi:hypothetical protein